MKYLTIINFGPLHRAAVELKDINVVIGPQSSGKSCLLKIASYCTWVEKRIQLTQNPDLFAEAGYFMQRLTTFHKLEGYARAETEIVYETDSMRFAYTHAEGRFTFAWKDGRWDYRTPKVSYVPAERNMVAAIPNWFEVNMGDNNIRSFMSDWQKARQLQTGELPIFQLGVSYHYDKGCNSDKLLVEGRQPLAFTNASSGLQSLIPLYVYLDYLTRLRFTAEEESNVQRQTEYDNFLQTLHTQLFTTDGKVESKQLGTSLEEDGRRKISASIALARIGSFVIPFTDEKDANRCRDIYDHFTQLDSNEIFIEEPEQNLFPPTQAVLVAHLIDAATGDHPTRLFVATHSPYVVTAFMERLDAERFSLLLMVEESEGRYSVKAASGEEIQQAYDYSIDLFHNINHLGV